jgi:hypothetical protein
MTGISTKFSQLNHVDKRLQRCWFAVSAADNIFPVYSVEDGDHGIVITLTVIYTTTISCNNCMLTMTAYGWLSSGGGGGESREKWKLRMQPHCQRS